MADDADPPRKFYGLKPTEFERANAAPSPPPAAGAASDPGPAPASDPGQRIDVRELVRAGSGRGPALGHNATVNRANEVHAILQDNLTRANAAGLNDVVIPPKRKSRRQRDYFVLMIGMNGFFIASILMGRNIVSLIYGLAGIVITSVGLTWVMFGIMDDY